MPTLPERFFFVVTEDGSPSLRFAAGDGAFSEAMHNLKGAFSETVYIYGAALQRAKERGLAPRVFSLGLGLGYNEILAACHFARPLAHHASISAHPGTGNLAGERAAPTDADDPGFYLESFELDADLRRYFAAWVLGDSLPAEFADAYELILARSCAETGASAGQVRECLRRWLSEGRLVLRDALRPETPLSERFSVFLFDAFSSKTSPELWKEEFLVALLNRTALPEAVFSTYACTGNLKRALKASGFALEIRQGFQAKRDSTFAVR